MNRPNLFPMAVFALCVLFGFNTNASELDKDVANQQRPELSETVIFRVNNTTKEVSAVKISDLKAQSESEAIAVATQAKYSPVSQEKLRPELDKETGSSSWYWYWYGYSYYPTYYYYGYNYYPYYYCNYGAYSYYWYGYYNYRWW